MELTKEALLAMGLTEEQADAILAAHTAALTQAQTAAEEEKRQLELRNVLKQAGVKEKFLDAAMALLNTETPVEEQIAAIREKFSEYFETPEAPKPAFGGQPKGSLPEPKGRALGALWGFDR